MSGLAIFEALRDLIAIDVDVDAQFVIAREIPGVIEDGSSHWHGLKVAKSSSLEVLSFAWPWRCSR